MPVENVDQAAAAAAALQTAGVSTVILTLGERGALLAEETGTRIFPAFDVEPVDTTAAGDAFLAGLAVALAEGRMLDEAVQWANAAGALATTKLGAQTSLPSRQTVEQLLANLAASSPGDAV
jgi:ribokinase